MLRIYNTDMARLWVVDTPGLSWKQSPFLASSWRMHWYENAVLIVEEWSVEIHAGCCDTDSCQCHSAYQEQRKYLNDFGHISSGLVLLTVFQSYHETPGVWTYNLSSCGRTNLCAQKYNAKDTTQSYHTEIRPTSAVSLLYHVSAWATSQAAISTCF